MWAIDNRTAYAAERNWTRDKHGVHLWLVAVRATFDVSPDGRVKLTDEQPPPLLEPQYRGDPAASSLRLDSDLLAAKPGTDVVVDAHAHAPGGRPAATVPVSLRVGAMEKTLLVHGTRAYYRGLTGLATSKPLPFTKAPIQYEFAFGGTDTSHPDPRKHRIDMRNPIGKGFAIDSDRLVSKPAHTVEYPHGNPAKSGPAGFGPIASFWSPRLELAGTYDARWEAAKKPLLPDDYDERFAMCSPVDQRPAKPLRGGERVELSNMTRAGVLRFELPKIYLTFTTRFGSRREEHRATLTTVAVLAEEMRLAVTWQSVLKVPAREAEYLDQTTISEKPYLA
jgi:hypothetical protein